MSAPSPDSPPTDGNQKRPRVRNVKSHNVTREESFNSGNTYAGSASTWTLPEAMKRTETSDDEAEVTDTSPNTGEDVENIESYNRKTKLSYNSNNVFGVPKKGKSPAQGRASVSSGPVYTEEPAPMGALQHTKSDPLAAIGVSGSSKASIPDVSVFMNRVSAPEVPTVHASSKGTVYDMIMAPAKGKAGDIQKVSESEALNVQHSKVLATVADVAQAQHSAVSQVGESQSTLATGVQESASKTPSMESMLERQKNVTLQQNKLAAVARNTHEEQSYSDSLKGLATATGDIWSLIQAKMESQKVTKHLVSLALDCQVITYTVLVVCEERQNFDKNVDVLTKYLGNIYTLAIKILKRSIIQKKTQRGKDKTDLQTHQSFLQTWFESFTELQGDTISAFLKKMRDSINAQKALAA